MGISHIDLAEVSTEEGKLYLFVAIARVSKFAFAELHERATPGLAADFLRRLIEHVAYVIHTVLTDNGLQIHPSALRLILARRARPPTTSTYIGSFDAWSFTAAALSVP